MLKTESQSWKTKWLALNIKKTLKNLSNNDQNIREIWHYIKRQNLRTVGIKGVGEMQANHKNNLFKEIIIIFSKP